MLIAAAVAAPFVLDLNDYKSNIASLAKEYTGRTLAIDGSIDLSILPIPTIKVSGVRISNLEGAASPDMLRIATVEASVALTPLFRGDIEIGSLTFIDPVLELETLADGRVNWLFEIAGGGDASGGGGGGAAVRIDSLKIENATLIYRDSAEGRVERIENLHLEAAMGSLEGPYSASGRVVVQIGGAEALPLNFEIEIDRLDRRPLPLRATITLASADASINFTGSASSASADAELTGKLKLDGASLGRLLTVIGGGPSDPLLDQPFAASATMTATAAAAGINDIQFNFGGIQGSGAINATLAPDPQIDIAIALNRVDIDALMASAGVPGGDGGDGGDGAGSTAAAGPFTLPGGVYVTLDLRIDALVYNQAVVRQAQFVAALDQSVLTLQQASALLPGGSDITLFGVLDSLDGKPHFTGQIEASADNLRAVLDWLEIAYPEIPTDRLRKFSLVTKIEVTPNLAKISAIDLRLDSSRLSGGVNVGIGARPAFNAIIAIDKINLDAYLSVQGEARPGEDGGNPLAALNTFDAEIKTKIGSLIYQGITVSGLALDAGVRSGVFTLRSLVIGDLAGAGGTISGVLDSARPGFDLTYDLEIGDAARLFQAAGMAPPSPDMGAMTAKGKLSGDLSAVTLDSRITMANAEARIEGAVTGLAGVPMIDAEISLETDSLSGLARRFGVTLAATADTPFSLSGKVKGDGAAAAVGLTVRALGADARLDGSLDNLLEAPRYDLTIAVSHPDFVTLVESLAGGVRFENRDLGEFRLRAKISGDGGQARIEGIDALLGPSRIAGVVVARFDGKRPYFDADLTTGEFVADMFLAAATQGGGSAKAGAAESTAGAPAERWSRDPIDLAGLRGFDLDARIASKALVFRKYRFEDVSLRIKLERGILLVEDLSGRLYGGAATVRARLAASVPPKVSISFTLKGADMRALMIDAADVDAVSGLLDLSGEFNTKGRSEFELISALQGKAKLAARDGSIEGIDLGELNRRLANIDNEVDMIALIGGALNGGATAIKSLKGTLTASGGVLRSDDIHAVLDGGVARATASIDLPRWQLAINSEFRLTGHPKAPPVGLLLMGPIDNPEREIRDQALREFVIAKIIGTGVRKLLTPAIVGTEAVGGALGGVLNALTGGALQTEPAPAEAETQPAEESPPAEPAPKLFENLLDGLIKGVGN